MSTATVTDTKVPMTTAAHTPSLDVQKTMLPGSMTKSEKFSKFWDQLGYGDLRVLCYGSRPVIDTATCLMDLDLAGHRPLVKAKDATFRLVLGPDTILSGYKDFTARSELAKQWEESHWQDKLTVELERWSKESDEGNPKMLQKIEEIVDPKATNW